MKKHALRSLLPAVLTVALAVSAQAVAAPDPIELTKAAVADRMRDPTSVLFRDVRVAGTCNGITYVDGWENGKNGYGGYVGFTIFLVRIEQEHAKLMQAYGLPYATAAEFQTAAACMKD